MKLSTALFASVVAISCLSCSIKTNDTKKEAEQGNARAQYDLGEMYTYGDGVSQDDTEAAKWYRKAADQGDAKAQYNLGVMYANGVGVPNVMLT